MRKTSEKETLFFCSTNSPIGPLMLAASEKGLVAIEFAGRAFPPEQHPKFQYVNDSEPTRACAEELTAYFRGDLKQFTVPLDLRGTEFQLRCWRALMDVPYGETCSYADIARVVGSPHGFRAVGMANHSNPIPIIVPCHRVVAANGTLCGYGGGLDIKRKLLELEQGELKLW